MDSSSWAQPQSNLLNSKDIIPLFTGSSTIFDFDDTLDHHQRCKTTCCVPIVCVWDLLWPMVAKSLHAL
jgi:hypothetical protein